MERKLVTIVAADIAGFSRLVGVDEEATLAALREIRNTLVDPLIAQHDGRIANTASDSLLVEFASPVEATRCAVAVQAGMAGRNTALPEDRRIEFRIGINLGDVVDNGGDLLGDGVNIAARLEALAPPGGIIVSRAIRDQVRDRIDLPLADLGEVEVKNITRAVRAFQVLGEGDAPVAVPARATRLRLPLLMAAAAALAVAVGVWVFVQRPDFTPVDPAEMALELPAKPAIAVLPFETRGDDAARDWIADGITESIISTLSQAPDMIVIARSTILKYKDTVVDTAQVSRDLGVRYVLSGSVLTVGDTIRVTTELADAVEGKQIWSLQKESTQDNLLTLLDGLSQKVFEEMSVSLTVGEGTRNWIELAGGFDNYVTVINGRAEFQKFSPEGHAKAERLWSGLLADNPDQAFANYLMGYLHWQKVVMRLSTNPAADWAEAGRLARRALELREFGDFYTLAAVLALEEYRHDDAIALADKAVALAPSSADTNALAGMVKATSGQTREGLELMELGMRLEPDYPGWLPAPVNFARLELGRYDQAEQLATEVLASDIRDVRAKPFAAAVLTAVAVFEGDLTAAQKRARRLTEIFPKASAANARQIRRAYKNQVFVERYIDALVQAGIPEN